VYQYHSSLNTTLKNKTYIFASHSIKIYYSVLLCCTLQLVVFELQSHGCMLKHLKNLKTVFLTNFLYNLIVKHDVICHEKPELQAYARKLAHLQSKTFEQIL